MNTSTGSHLGSGNLNGPFSDVAGVVTVDEHVPSAGAIVWWRLSGRVDYATLEAAWVAEGLDPKLLPTPCSATTALRRAAHDLKEKRRLVRPLGKGNGFAVVREQVTNEHAELKHEVLCKVTLDGVERLKVETVNASDEASAKMAKEVQAAYEQHMTALETEDISSWLVRLMPKLDAVGLRDSGGVYFIPHTAMARMSDVVGVLRKVSGHVVNRVPAMRTDDTVEAILDALNQEAEDEARRMEEDIEAAKLGARGFENRIARTDEVESKVSRYELMLGRKLDAMRARLELLRANLTVAMMKADTNAGGGESLANL